jgi:5-formyltetrahydrofolate cyclo-ligase
MDTRQPPPFLEKSLLRKQLRQARRALPEAFRRTAARQIERLAMHHRLLDRHQRMGFFIPSKGEIDCLPLLNRALWLGAACYLPIVPQRRQRKLWFSQMGNDAHWKNNRFGIPEYGHAFRKIRAHQLDVLFMPLLGFDLHGTRMGMGGGFYDASLAFLQKRTHWHRPRLIGLAFEAQKVECLPRDAWDVPLDAVLTERALYRFRRTR